MLGDDGRYGGISIVGTLYRTPIDNWEFMIDHKDYSKKLKPALAVYERWINGAKNEHHALSNSPDEWRKEQFEIFKNKHPELWID